MFAVNINAYSPDLGKTLSISGGDKVALGPYSTLTLQNATMQLVRMTANSANLGEISVTGQYVGGDEPYVPTIISAPTATLSDGYALTGPFTYDSLQKAVLNFSVGEAVLPQFTFTHPSSYSLNRTTNTYTSVGTWVVTGYNTTITNFSKSYLIYIHFNAYGIMIVTLSGEDDSSLPDNRNLGYGGTIGDAQMHIVYAYFGEMTLQDLTVAIT